MTEIAYFTPKSKTGSAHYLDIYNADLFWGTSDLTNLWNQNAVQLRTYQGGANGVIRAYFTMPAADYCLVIAKLSGGGSQVEIKIGSSATGTFTIAGNGDEIPLVAHLPAGSHWIDIKQLSGSLWIHSITCFRI